MAYRRGDRRPDVAVLGWRAAGGERRREELGVGAVEHRGALAALASDVVGPLCSRYSAYRSPCRLPLWRLAARLPIHPPSGNINSRKFTIRI